MGTARASSRHRVIVAVAIMSVLVMFAPVFVLAQGAQDGDQFQRNLEQAIDEGIAEQKTCAEEPKQPKCNPVCWQQEQCKKEKGVWEQSKKSDEMCPSVEGKWGYCFPPNVETTLQIPIGEAKDVADVGKYLKTVYLFLLGIGGLVGAITLIHAGFLWIVSGGNAASIERAKKHIQDAAIGLLLLFGSYTILSAINPDLVKLKVPKAQLLRNLALEFEPVKVGKMGSECNVADQRSVNECRAACPGCECFEFDNAMVTLAQVVSWGAVAAAGSAMFAGTAVAHVGSKVLSAGGKTLKYFFGKTLSFCTGSGFPIPIVCALGAGTAIDDAARKLTGKGVCMPPAKNLPAGELCAFNANCASGKCVGGSTEAELGLIGVCGDGTDGSPCREIGDCNQMPENDRVCAEGPGDTKWCATAANRKKGSPCRAREVGDELTSECGLGLGCKVTEGDLFTFSTKEGIGWCVGEREAAGGPPQYVGDSCTGVDCPVGLRCQAWEFGKAESCNMVCDSDEACVAACPPGEQCYCGDASPRICVKGARVVAAPAPVEILQNGGAGCDNQAARRCADGLICTADATLYRDGGNVRGPSHVCTDKQPDSLCTSNEECQSNRCEAAAGAFPNGDPELKCV